MFALVIFRLELVTLWTVWRYPGFTYDAWVVLVSICLACDIGKVWLLSVVASC